MIFKLHSYDHTKIKKGMNPLFQLWHNKKTRNFTSRGQTCETMGKINEYLENLLSVDEILHLIHICRETYIIITALPPFIVDLEHVFSQKNQHHHHCNVEKMKSTQNWEYQSIKSSEYVFQTRCFKSDHCLADFPAVFL